MPPKLLSDDQRNTLIRPLAYVPESNLIELAKAINMPIIPCNLCGSQENLQRARVKSMLQEWERAYPHIGSSMLKAQQNIRSSQLLDRQLWAFSQSDLMKRQV